MSTAKNGWHLDEELARRYAENRVPGMLATSVEQHLASCSACRALLRSAVPTARLTAVWAEVLERVEAPPSAEWSGCCAGPGSTSPPPGWSR